MGKKILTLEEFEERCRPSAELLEANLHDDAKTSQEWGFVRDLTVPLEDGRHPFVLCGGEESGLYMGIRFPVGEEGWYIPLLIWKPESKKEIELPAEKIITPDVSQE